MKPWSTFIVGVMLSNLFQWAQWVGTRTDKKGLDRWAGYWEMGLPHLVMNVAVDVLACVAWSNGWLDNLVAMVPGGPQNVGIPYVPGIGVGLGFFVDLFADKLVFVFRKVVVSRLPFLNSNQAPSGAPKEGP